MLIFSVDRPTRRLPTSSFIIKKRAAISGLDVRIGAGSPRQFLIVRLKPLLCAPRDPLAPPSTLNQSAIAMSENASASVRISPPKDLSFRYVLFFFARNTPIKDLTPSRFVPSEARFYSSFFERSIHPERSYMQTFGRFVTKGKILSFGAFLGF